MDSNGQPVHSMYDLLIVGAGVFGTSTAYHLAQTNPGPSKILVLDRAQCPSPMAASSDINKIIRADYSKTFYMDLAYEAIDMWSEGEIYKPFYHQTGWVMLDEKDSDLSTRIRANFKASGRPDPSEDLDIAHVKSKWGGVLAEIDTTGFDKAYTNSIAGWADASAAVAAMMEYSIKKHIAFEVGEVDRLKKLESHFQVKTQTGTIYKTRKLLLATGAWTPWLMSPLEGQLKIPTSLSIRTQISAAGVCVASFRLTKDEAAYYEKMPVLIYGSHGEVMPPNRDQLFKFTNSHTFLNTRQHPITGHQISVPDPIQDAVPQKLKDESLAIVRRRIPALLEGAREPDLWRLCWDAVSPDQNQLICQHPDSRLSGLYFATAGSFHSWKFLPNIGRYVVNVLKGISNGPERDTAWAWKNEWADKGAHPKVIPRSELAEYLAS